MVVDNPFVGGVSNRTAATDAPATSESGVSPSVSPSNNLTDAGPPGPAATTISGGESPVMFAVATFTPNPVPGYAKKDLCSTPFAPNALTCGAPLAAPATIVLR